MSLFSSRIVGESSIEREYETNEFRQVPDSARSESASSELLKVRNAWMVDHACCTDGFDRSGADTNLGTQLVDRKGLSREQCRNVAMNESC